MSWYVSTLPTGQEEPKGLRTLKQKKKIKISMLNEGKLLNGNTHQITMLSLRF